MNINWKFALGLGIAIWVLMFVIVSAFVAFRVYETTVSKIIIILISGILAYLAAGYAKPENYLSAISYGAAWVIVGLALDFLITTKFNPVIFSSRSLWAGYLLVLLAPLLKSSRQETPNSTSSSIPI